MDGFVVGESFFALLLHILIIHDALSIRSWFEPLWGRWNL